AHLRRPATLTPMLDRLIHIGEARLSGPGTILDNRTIPITAKDHDRDDAERWTKMLLGNGALTFASHTTRRVIIDLGDYFCAFPELTVTGGANSIVRIFWAESLYDDFAGHIKGNRDAIDG